MTFLQPTFRTYDHPLTPAAGHRQCSRRKTRAPRPLPRASTTAQAPGALHPPARRVRVRPPLRSADPRPDAWQPARPGAGAARLRSRSRHPLFLLSCGAVFLPCFVRFVVFLGVIKTNDVLRRAANGTENAFYNSPPQLCTRPPGLSDVREMARA